MTPPNRTPPLRRGLSTILAVAYVVVALGAARHAGEHDASGLEWLPEEYHHHDLHLEERDAPGVVALDLCVACHFSSLRLGEPDPSLAIGPPASPAAFVIPATDPRPAPLSDRTIRGPPRA